MEPFLGKPPSPDADRDSPSLRPPPPLPSPSPRIGDSGDADRDPPTPRPPPPLPSSSPEAAAPGDAVPGVRKLPVFAALAQGFFCLVIGLWPVVSLQSFQSVTGQKPDHWLLTLAGLLLAGIGCSMLISAIRRDVAFEVFAIGLITALSLCATDIIFVIERSIPAVYLLDAVAESLFVTLWVFAIRSTRSVAYSTRSARRPPADDPPAPPINVKTNEPGGMDDPK